MSTWYRTGTISVANGSTTVTGVGTAFVANVSPGMMVVHQMRIIGEVAAVVGDTQLTLAEAYAGTAISGDAYAIANLGSVRTALINLVSQAVALFTAAADGALAGRFTDGTDAAPGIAFANDTGMGWRRVSAGVAAFVQGGVRRLLLSSTALQVDVPLTGTAVQSSATDKTAGRVMLNGAHGLGGEDLGAVAITDANTPLPTGFYAGPGSSGTNYPGSNSRFSPFLTLNRRVTSGSWVSIRMFFNGDNTPWIRRSADNGVTWDTEVKLWSNTNILGAVSQSGGVPTGAALSGNASTASPAGGYSERLANGFQRVHHVVTTSTGGDTTVTFTEAFLTGSTPAVNITPVGDADYRPRLVSISPTAVVLSIRDSGGARVAVPAHLNISGRWSNMT